MVIQTVYCASAAIVSHTLLQSLHSTQPLPVNIAVTTQDVCAGRYNLLLDLGFSLLLLYRSLYSLLVGLHHWRLDVYTALDGHACIVERWVSAAVSQVFNS